MKGGEDTKATDLKRYELTVIFHAADDAEVTDLVDSVMDFFPLNAAFSTRPLPEETTTPSA